MEPEQQADAYALRPQDELRIAEWRQRGYTIPVPELTGERLDNFINELGKIFQRFEDRLAGKR